VSGAAPRAFGSGRYEVIDELGAGGMGEVFLVRIKTSGARAALKVLEPRLAREPDRLERFRREASAMGALDHPHLVKSLDFAIDPDGAAFVVMELLDGRSLARIVAEDGPLEPARAARLGAQIASALHAAHERGIVHRDVKPSNVVVVRGYDGGELAKVIDFGIAAIKESETYDRLTKTGQILGTPNFMAPEQVRGEEVDGRTDVYGLGACLYAALTGRPPYPGTTIAEVCVPLLAGDRPPLRVLRPDVGPLAMIVDRALALAPEDRFATAGDFERALARHATPSAAPPAPILPARVPEIAPTRERRAPRSRLLANVIASALAAAALAVALVAIVSATSESAPASVGAGAGLDAGAIRRSDTGPREVQVENPADEPFGVAEGSPPFTPYPEKRDGRTWRVLSFLRVAVEADGPEPAGLALVRETAARNSEAFTQCWALSESTAGRWKIDWNLDTSPAGADYDRPRTTPVMTREQMRCLAELITRDLPRRTDAFHGRFVLVVSR
jgi:serine/threonine-protein kinase